jgi:hypothetical protein
VPRNPYSRGGRAYAIGHRGRPGSTSVRAGTAPCPTGALPAWPRRQLPTIQNPGNAGLKCYLLARLSRNTRRCAFSVVPRPYAVVPPPWQPAGIRRRGSRSFVEEEAESQSGRESRAAEHPHKYGAPQLLVRLIGLPQCVRVFVSLESVGVVNRVIDPLRHRRVQWSPPRTWSLQTFLRHVVLHPFVEFNSLLVSQKPERIFPDRNV